MKLVNNGKKAVHVSSVVVKVAKSAPDPTPLPMVFGGYDQVQCFDLVNEGWEPIDTVQFDFTFSAKEPAGVPAETLPYQRTFQRVKERLRINLTEELGKAGVAPVLTAAAKVYLQGETARRAMETNTTDFAKLEKDPAYQKLQEENLKQYGSMSALDPKLAGPFQKSCWIHGRMTLAWNDGAETRSKTLPFRVPILIFPPDGLGAPGPVTGRYEAMLREAGENYQLPVNVSRVVKAGGIDRFVITLGIPRTSKHELSLELKTTAGETLTSGPVSIEGLLPRSTVWMLEQAKSQDP